MYVFHNLQMIEIDNHQRSRRHNFELKRTQQIEFLLELLQTSKVKKQIKKIKFGLKIDKGYDKECMGTGVLQKLG